VSYRRLSSRGSAQSLLGTLGHRAGIPEGNGSLSFENLFLHVHRQLIAWSVLVEADIPLDEFPVAPNLAALKSRLHDLLGNQWSDRWIKATNKKRARIFRGNIIEPTDPCTAHCDPLRRNPKN
jgi:hypothetical protein